MIAVTALAYLLCYSYLNEAEHTQTKVNIMNAKTIAQRIMQDSHDELMGVQVYEAHIQAEHQASDEAFNWDDNSTTYTFADGSKLIFSENNVRLG